MLNVWKRVQRYARDGKVGVANQTTMPANESLAIAARIRAAMVAGHGEEYTTRTRPRSASDSFRVSGIEQVALDP